MRDKEEERGKERDRERREKICAIKVIIINFIYGIMNLPRLISFEQNVLRISILFLRTLLKSSLKIFFLLFFFIFSTIFEIVTRAQFRKSNICDNKLNEFIKQIILKLIVIVFILLIRILLTRWAQSHRHTHTHTKVKPEKKNKKQILQDDKLI